MWVCVCKQMSECVGCVGGGLWEEVREEESCDCSLRYQHWNVTCVNGSCHVSERVIGHKCSRRGRCVRG